MNEQNLGKQKELEKAQQANLWVISISVNHGFDLTKEYENLEGRGFGEFSKWVFMTTCRWPAGRISQNKYLNNIQWFSVGFRLKFCVSSKLHFLLHFTVVFFKNLLNQFESLTPIVQYNNKQCNKCEFSQFSKLTYRVL